MKYHVFVFDTTISQMNQQDAESVYIGGFNTLQQVMDYRFPEEWVQQKDMRNCRALCYMATDDGMLRLIRFAYCSRVSLWGSWYDVNQHPNYGYQDERRA